jgi:hypothetical protein
MRRDDGRVRSDRLGDDEVAAVRVGACERGSCGGGGDALEDVLVPGREGAPIDADDQ